MQPKGKLLIIGGAENLAGQDAPDMETKNIKFKHYEILKSLLSVSRKSIVIITAASRIQNKVRQNYLRAFEELDYSPRFIQIRERYQCNDRKFIEDIKEMGAVFFTGGDQSRLTALLANTRFIRIIKDRYLHDADFLVAGTSAGAMALSDVMIAEGIPNEAIIAQHLKLRQGFGIASNCIIDTHFIKRSRFGRLTHAVLLHPHYLGIGLGEDTALIIRKGTEVECRGSGMVVLIDGRFIRKTNSKIAKKGEPIYAENLKVHLLVQGNRFSLKKNLHFEGTI